MATLKLKKPAQKTAGRPPLRGRGVAPRPTREQADAARRQRDAAAHGAERRPAPGDRPRHEGGAHAPQRPHDQRGGGFGPRRDARDGDRPAPRGDDRGGAWQGPRRDEGAGPRRDAGPRDDRGGPRPGGHRDERAGPQRGGHRDEGGGARPGGQRDERTGPRHDAGPDRRPGGPGAWQGERRDADQRRPDERRGPPAGPRHGRDAPGGDRPPRRDDERRQDFRPGPGQRDDRRGPGPAAWHDDRRGRPADDRGGRHRDDRPGAHGQGPRDDRQGPRPAGGPHGGPHDRRPAPRDDHAPWRGDAPPHHPARRGGEAPHGQARPHDRDAPRGDARRGDAPQGPRRADDRRPPPAGDRRADPAGGRPQPGWPRRDDRPRPPGPPPRQQRDDDDDFEPVPHAEGSLRLSKRMVQLGLASRREADEWIAKGWVRVDGRPVSTLGARVQPEQVVTLDARASGDQAQRVTILLNKPAGHVSGQAEDGNEPAIALVKPQTHWEGDASGRRFAHVHLRGIAPAGRLDLESTGLLVFTQDGRIAKQLIGEDSEIEKEYLVQVEPARGDVPAGGAPPPSDDDLALLRHGLELDGEPLRPAGVERLEDGRLRFVLKQGKKRQIRRMCEAVGLKVTALERVRIGGVRLDGLPPGQWRYLRDDEAFG